MKYFLPAEACVPTNKCLSKYEMADAEKERQSIKYLFKAGDCVIRVKSREIVKYGCR